MTERTELSPAATALVAYLNTRVAIRRLRSTLRVFDGSVDAAALGATAQDLKWFAGLLGDVRDCQVQARRFNTAVDALPDELVMGACGPAFTTTCVPSSCLRGPEWPRRWARPATSACWLKSVDGVTTHRCRWISNPHNSAGTQSVRTERRTADWLPPCSRATMHCYTAHVRPPNVPGTRLNSSNPPASRSQRNVKWGTTRRFSPLSATTRTPS